MKIAMKILTLLLPACLLFVPATTQAEDEEEVAATALPPYYDYLLNVTFELDESKLSAFVVDMIYSDSGSSPPSTGDVLQLYGVPSITLERSVAALAAVNVSTSKVLSMEGFEVFLLELNLNFAEVYTRFFRDRLRLQGDLLKDFLEALKIDVAALSQGISFGTPDPLTEFKKGDFSEESVSKALVVAGRTQEELFQSCRDEFLEKAITTPKSSIVESFRRYGLDEKMALVLWKALGLSSKEVSAVNVFNEAMSDMIERLNSTSVLGILKDSGTFIVNSAAYNLWKDSSIANIFARSYSNKTRIQLRDRVAVHINDGIVGYNFMNFNESERAVTYASTGSSNGELEDCYVVIPQGAALVKEDVYDIHNDFDHLHCNINSTMDVVLGVPLICQEQVYGLANNIDEDKVVRFDSFYVVPHGNSARNSYVASFVILGLVFVFRV